MKKPDLFDSWGQFFLCVGLAAVCLAACWFVVVVILC